MHFTQNQLSPGLISLSLLRTAHPSTLQRTRVRTSTLKQVACFILAIRRSPGFGSCVRDYFTLSIPHNVPPLNDRHVTHTRTIIIQKARSQNTHSSLAVVPPAAYQLSRFKAVPHGTYLNSLSV